VLDDELARIVNISMALEMPLLLKGEPGTGKTMLAHSIATHPARMFAADAQHLALLQLNRPAQRFNLARSLGDSLAQIVLQGNARKQPIGKLNRVRLKVFDIVRNALAVQFVSHLPCIGQGLAVAVQLCNGFAVVGMGGNCF